VAEAAVGGDGGGRGAAAEEPYRFTGSREETGAGWGIVMFFFF
jgi:hypothetical protein